MSVSPLILSYIHPCTSMQMLAKRAMLMPPRLLFHAECMSPLGELFFRGQRIITEFNNLAHFTF